MSPKTRGALLPWLPFGGNVHLLPGEGAEAVVFEERRAVFLDEALDGLTPPPGVSVAGELQHQRPVNTHTHICKIIMYIYINKCINYINKYIYI